MAAVDLNCDCGEGFGVYAMGDDRAMLRHRHQLQTWPAAFTPVIPTSWRRPSPSARRMRCGGRRPSRLRRPRRLRPPRPAGDGGRGRGGSSPTRSVAAARARRLRRPLPDPRQAARRAEQPRDGRCRPRRRHRPGQPRGRRASSPSSPSPAPNCSAPARRRGCAPCARSTPTAATRTRAALAPRGAPGAVLHDAAAAAARAARMVADGAVVSLSGRRVPVGIDSICVHGDTPGAVGHGRARCAAALEAAGIAVAAFAGPRRAAA